MRFPCTKTHLLLNGAQFVCYAKILVASERTRRKISYSLALGDITLYRQQIYDDRFFKKLTGTPLTPLGDPYRAGFTIALAIHLFDPIRSLDPLSGGMRESELDVLL